MRAANGLTKALLAACPATRFLRDASRGGVATVLNEIAQAAVVEIVIDEAALPIREEVKGMCEILGLDPLYLANEGKLVAVVPGEDADAALATLRAHPLGREARMIGRVSERAESRVLMRTLLGGTRIVDMLVGDQLRGFVEAAMHELAITRNIVTIVGDAARGRRVTLEIGRLLGVMADAVAFCFDIVAAGTPLAGAALYIREIDGHARCRDCGAEFAAATLFAPCPCGSRRSDRLQGEELNIKAMELEEAA